MSETFATADKRGKRQIDKAALIAAKNISKKIQETLWETLKKQKMHLKN